MKQMIMKSAALVAAVLMGSIGWAETVRVYVAPDGSGDGSSWESAAGFEDAMAALGTKGTTTYEAEVEIWMKEGVYTKTADSATYTIPAKSSVVIRGGFAGTEGSAAERAEGTYSTIDGVDTYKTFIVNNTGALEIERMVFTRSRWRGLEKASSGGLKLKDCSFTANGLVDPLNTAGYGPNFSGHGAYFEGSASSTIVSMDKCLFDGNIDTNGWYDAGQGYGLYAKNLKKVVMKDCSFLTNGYSFAQTQAVNTRTWHTIVHFKDAPVAATNCVFRGNVAYTGGAGGIVWLNGNCDGSTFDHCQWVGNRVTKVSNDYWAESTSSGTGVLNVDLGDRSRMVDFTSCTIAYNMSCTKYSAAGLNVIGGTANVKDSIFYGNVIPSVTATDENDVMVMSSAGAANLRYTLLDHEPSFANCENVVVGVPEFVTTLDEFLALINVDGATYPKVNLGPKNFTFRPEAYEAVMNLDVHCKSKAGYYKNDGKEYTDAAVSSYAIDTGDVESAYENEGAPNGGRINLGVYGNTAEAAKSFVGQPTVSADDIKVEWLNGYTQPKMSVAIGGTDEYNATVEIYMNVNGGEYKKIVAAGGMRSGNSLEGLYTDWLTDGGFISVKVVVKAYGVEDLVVEKSFTIEGAVPNWVGKGGDAAKIVHVRGGATGKKDGTSWGAAFDSFVDAMRAMTKERNEIWIAGTNVLTKYMGTPAHSFAFTVRGGFVGTENSVEERKADVISGLDGAWEYPTFAVNCSSTVTVERVLFMRSYYQGLSKTGNGNLVLKDCHFLQNGSRVSGGVNGRGAYVNGNSGLTEVRIENCLFEGNTDGKGVNDAGYGFGVGLWNVKKSVILDTVFLTNGYYLGTQRKGSRGIGGAAIYAENAPVMATNCQFIGNVMYSNSGAIVKLVNSCDGSVFDHCLWAGNRDTRSANYSEGVGMGMLTVAMNGAAKKVDLESCTMAYNLCGTITNAAGVNVTKGIVNIHNSILYGNLVQAANTNDSEVMVHDAANAAINISYTMMDHEPKQKGAGVNCENLIVGVPEFVMGREDFLGLIYTNKDDAISFPKVDMNTVDMRFNGDEETFAAIANIDMHSLSRAGYYKNDGLKYMDAKVGSPAVDAGDPASDFTKEGAPNGHRVNLGFYGNTAQAALSKGGFCLRIQ